MTLASSGYISLGGTDPARSANLAAGQAATATITMPSSVTRTLTGVSSGAIVLPNDYWNKPVVTAVPDLSLLAATYLADYIGTLPNTGTLSMDPSGAWYWSDTAGDDYGGYWVSSGAGFGIGSNFWLRTTRTSTVGTNGSSTSTASGAWVNMGTPQEITIVKTSGGSNAFSAYYTFEISNSSSGSPVISSRSNILFTASRV